jgi:hypothetical protein
MSRILTFFSKKIHEKCSVVAERRQEWTNLIDQHLKEYPGTLIGPEIQPEIPQISSSKLFMSVHKSPEREPTLTLSLT